MELQNVMQERYSCRKFSQKSVEPEKIEAILRAGMLAPTAKNQQPVKLFRLESETALEAVHAVTQCTFGAQTFLLVGTKEEEGWVRPFDQAPFADVDGAIVATHMLLKITDLGLATTWVGYFDAPKLQELLPQTAGYHLVALFPLGYAAPDAAPSPRHTERKTLEEMTVTL